MLLLANFAISLGSNFHIDIALWVKKWALRNVRGPGMKTLLQYPSGNETESRLKHLFAWPDVKRKYFGKDHHGHVPSKEASVEL